MGKVTPLRQPGRVTPRTAPAPPLPLQTCATSRRRCARAWSASRRDPTETGEELVFVRHGLRRPRSQEAAPRPLGHPGRARPARVQLRSMRGSCWRNFSAHCARNGVRCVRIVHGKGLRSKNRQPVLKSKVAHWLMQRDEILAFCQARPTEGGGGAVVVLLKGEGGRRKDEE